MLTQHTFKTAATLVTSSKKTMETPLATASAETSLLLSVTLIRLALFTPTELALLEPTLIS